MLKATQPNHPMLVPKVLTEYDMYMLWVFRQLDRDRQYTMSGAMPVNLNSILNYCTLFGDSLTTDEILMLQRMDIAYLNKQHELQEQLNP
jgi:hypothetical protein